MPWAWSPWRRRQTGKRVQRWTQGGGSSSDTTSSSSSEIGESLSGSDGEEQYNTDVSDTRLGRAMGSDSDEFSTDVSDSRKRRRREGGLGKEARTYPAREGTSGALGLL